MTAPAGFAVKLEGVEVSFLRRGKGGERVLSGITAAIGPGDSVAVLGPSGSGKTTLLKVIAGQQPVSGGRVAYGFDHDRPGQFGYVSQSNSLLPWLTVRENVEFPLKVLRRGSGSAAAADSLLREVGLQEHAGKYPSGISGGMARRAMLARALVFEPSFLLLDEPFGGLDAGTKYRLVELLRQLRERHGFTQVCVEHDVEAAVRLAGTFWLMPGPGAPLERITFGGPPPGAGIFSAETEARYRSVVESLSGSRAPGSE